MTDLSKQHHAYGWSPCDQGYNEYFGGASPMSYFSLGNIIDKVKALKDKAAPVVQKITNVATKINTTLNGASQPQPGETAEQAAERLRKEEIERKAAERKKIVIIAGVASGVILLVTILIIVLKKRKK